MEKRLAFDPCHRIPDGHVDVADRDRALAVGAGLVVGHHRRPGPVSARQAALVEQGLGRRRQQARDEVGLLTILSIIRKIRPNGSRKRRDEMSDIHEPPCASSEGARMADTAALTVRRGFPRPPEPLVARLRDVPTGWLVDANGRRGALAHTVRPITVAVRFCGVALTVQSRPRDNLAPYAAIQHARPGDVMVVATDAYEEASVAGDVLLGMARNRGICALVTDGMVRDVLGLNAVGIPVFARGLSPNSPYKDGPGTIGLPVTLAGMTVEAGDVVVGDQDGVVVIARDQLASVIEALADVAAKEAKMDEMVAAGATLPAGLEQLIAARGVRFLD
jgi:4-hydroxy-4-methyl-2-oxoglutarate aldolase